MVKLSDYLDYLYKEVIEARKLVDERSVELAREYAKHEYLKYFRVPRFTMPSVKMDIPLKVDALDAETKYNFKMDENSFIADVNKQIHTINEKKNLKIPPVTKEGLSKIKFDEVIKDLEKGDYRFVRRLDDSINKIDFSRRFKKLEDNFSPSDDNGKAQKSALDAILQDSLRKQFTPVSARLNNIFVDPDTSKESDKDKMFIKLQVELVEEGLRIVNLTDENGKEFEEIVFE